MANYQIKLTPVDTFFFGGEKHTIDKDGNYETNYFVESNAYPQQTTLLGLVRYYLLLKNSKVFDGKKITDKTEAAKIIGNTSFDYNNVKCVDGKIQSISPLYFSNKGENYYFAPFDQDFLMDGDTQFYKIGKDGKRTNYNAKDHYYDVCQRLFSAKGDIRKFDDIVKTAPQVGNEKAGNGETKDNKFYKQMSKRMVEPGWSFCIDAEIEDGAGVPAKDKDSLFVPFGGEKSFFKLEVEPKDTASFGVPVSFKRTILYLFCLSDCFVGADILDKAKLAVNRYVSFRNLKTTVANTDKYSGLSGLDPAQMDRSNRFNLLQRGSVLYFDNKTDLDAAAGTIANDDNQHCINIGFNKTFINNQNK
ncbi:MAG: hypothetical protein NT004_16465 [Bacteroidetes bacterium]|nr:hypothetical protein [Bacteroidota bacterium]